MMSVFGLGIFAPAPKNDGAPQTSLGRTILSYPLRGCQGGEVWRLLHVLPAATDDDALLCLVQQLALQVVDALDALR